MKVHTLEEKTTELRAGRAARLIVSSPAIELICGNFVRAIEPGGEFSAAIRLFYRLSEWLSRDNDGLRGSFVWGILESMENTKHCNNTGPHLLR